MDAIRTPHRQEADRPIAFVFEKRPRWAPELERQFANEDARVVSCRSLHDVVDRSAAARCGVVVIDIAVDTADCLRFLGRRLGNPPALPVIVVAQGQTAMFEWPVRDLGACAFLAKRIPGHEMADLCRRQWSTSL